MRKISILACFIFSSFLLKAQVKQADISLEFNSQTCLYDVYLNVVEGKTSKLIDRVQSISQLTVVAPASSTVYVEDTYMPLVNNQNRDSDTPAGWEVQSIIDAPAVTPEYSYHSVNPIVSPTAFYNDLTEGDKVKLFSINVSPKLTCDTDLRLFDNETDPKSIDEGMQGAGFQNIFTVGSPISIFREALPTVKPSVAAIKGFDFKNNRVSAIVEGEANACTGDLTYAWMYKGSVISNSQDDIELTRKQIATGHYSLVLTNALGCTNVKSISLGEEGLNNEVLSSNEEHNVTEDNNINREGGSSNVGVTLYPNPVMEDAFVEISGANGKLVKIQLTDLQGSVIIDNVINEKVSSDNEVLKISLRDCPTGAYNLSVFMDGNLTKSQRLIIIE